MPKKLHELKGFNVGIVTSPDQTDLAEDATPYSLDVSADNGDGMIVGRYSDEVFTENGFGSASNSNAQIVEITCVEMVSSNLNNKYFKISTPNDTYVFWFDIQNLGTSPPTTQNEIPIRIGINATDAAASIVGLAVSSVVQSTGRSGVIFEATHNSGVVTVTNQAKGIVVAGVDVGDSGFTIEVTTAGKNHNIMSKSMSFISKDTQQDLLYVDGHTNRLNRISDFYNDKTKVLGPDIFTDKVDITKKGRHAIIGRGKNASPLFSGYLDNTSFGESNDTYFTGNNELKPADKIQPLAKFTKIIKLSNDDDALYACAKGQPYIWRIDYNTGTPANLSSSYICSRLPFNVDIICECVSVGGSDSYIWAYSGPGEVDSDDYNSFEAADYHEETTSPGKLYKLKVNDDSNPIDWTLAPSLSITKTVDNFTFEINKEMNWTHDLFDKDWQGFARFGDILETGNDSKSILWFLIVPSSPEEDSRKHWFRTTPASEALADDSDNDSRPSSLAHYVGNYRTHRWLYAAKNIQDINEDGGSTTINLLDKTPQHMGTLSLDDDSGYYDLTNVYDYSSNLYSWRIKKDEYIWETQSLLRVSRYDESAESDESVEFNSTNLTAGGSTQTDGVGVYTIAKNIGMFTSSVFGNYTGDNCGTKWRTGTSAVNNSWSGAGPLAKNSVINICPLEYSLVDLTDEYGIDCDTDSDGNAVVGCMAKIGSQTNPFINGSDGVWMINKVDIATDDDGGSFVGLICDTVDSNGYTYTGGNPSNEYRVNLENKVVMYISSFKGNNGALSYYDTEDWTTGKSLGADTDYDTEVSHDFSGFKSSSPDNIVRQLRWFDDTTSSMKAMDFNGAQMPKQIGLQGLSANTTINTGRSALFYSFNNPISHDDGGGVVDFLNSLFAIDIRQVNGASNSDPDLNLLNPMGYFNDTLFQINFDGDGKSYGHTNVDNQHPRMQDSIMVIEDYNASGVDNQSTDVVMSTVPTARIAMFDRDSSMGLINIDIRTEISTINNTSPIDGETNAGSDENFTLNHFGRALTPLKYKFGTNDSFLSLITPSDPGTGTVFKCAQDYYYKISFLYDGFQESPLTLGHWKFNASKDYPDTHNATDGTHDYSYISLKLKVSNISSRITHLNLYRTDSTAKLYRLVKSVKMDSTWTSLLVSGTNVYTKVCIDEGVSGATYESINNMSEILRNTTVNYTISTVLDGSLYVGNCGHRNITDASSYIFKSNPGNFSQFDWTINYLKLPTIPVAMKAFRGRIYAWDESNMYVINSNLILEDIYEGIGCLSQDSVFAADVGMCFADKYNIYLQTTEYPTIISSPISVDREFQIGYKDLLDENTFKPIVSYSAKLNSFVISTNASRAYIYNVIKNRWDLWSTNQEFLSSVISPRNEVFYSHKSATVGDRLMSLSTSSDRSYFNWYSKKLTIGRDTQDKFFKKVRLTGDSLVEGTLPLIEGSKGEVSKTFSDDTDNVVYNLSGSNRKAKWLQLKFTNVSAIVHSIGILYRDRSAR